MIAGGVFISNETQGMRGIRGGGDVRLDMNVSSWVSLSLMPRTPAGLIIESDLRTLSEDHSNS